MVNHVETERPAPPPHGARRGKGGQTACNLTASLAGSKTGDLIDAILQGRAQDTGIFEKA